MKLSCTCLSSSDTAFITTNPTVKLVITCYKPTLPTGALPRRRRRCCLFHWQSWALSFFTAGRFHASDVSYSNAGLAMPWDA